jgi:hypothetical protein
MRRVPRSKPLSFEWMGSPRACALGPGAAAYVLALGLVASATVPTLAQQPPVPARSTAVEGVSPLAIDDPPPPPPGAAINQAGRDGATIRAFRLSGALDVDGVIDEPFYAATPAIREFVQGVPIEDGAPSELTEAWISFDDENVYVSARVWESGVRLRACRGARGRLRGTGGDH